MAKLLFAPVSIGGGLVAGVIGRKLFTALWGLVDDQEAPKPEHRDVPRGKLLAALAIEGALFTLVRGLVDLHRGTVAIDSEVDHGTTVTVRVPRSASAAR